MSSRPTVSTGNCKCHIITEEACTGAVRTNVPGSNGHDVVQVVRAAREMQLVLKLGHPVGHLFDHLRRLVLDYFPFHVVPASGVNPREISVLHITLYTALQLKEKDHIA